MLCNLSKTNLALPIATRISSQSKCIAPFAISKLHFFSHGSSLEPSQNPNFAASGAFPSRARKILQLIEPRKACIQFHGKRRRRSVLQCAQLERNVRFFSYAAGNSDPRHGDSLPWLADGALKDSKLGKNSNVKVKARRSSWEESAEKLVQRRSSTPQEEVSGSRRGKATMERKQVEWDESVEGEEDGGGRGEAETEVIDDPRWDKIKTKVERVVYAGRGSERPGMRRWSREESWGRKTFKQATESSLPKMVGEGVYGVGPVLAALSSGRREFYVLYVQEGLDLSGNNRKKKDKKGFEKVLRMADKIGLSVKEVSKHDLNMIVDNRPHQGLLLDASPLEMVNVKELDPVSADKEDKGLLWVALDEVTDPQNLGAIIRSTYFFGAAGIILCAKKSAPLSGVVSKASAGSLELMELRSCKNMMQFLTSSAENGWRVLGGSISSRAAPLDEVSPGRPTILVLGSEGTGLRPLVERSCTQLVRIPGNMPVDVSVRDVADEEDGETDHMGTSEEFQSFLAVESLNVSVAAGVLLNHLIGSNYRTRNHHQSSDNVNEILH